MKTVKINYPLVLLLIIAILAPLTAFGGPRDAAAIGSLDDQPWGGEIDNADYKTGSVNSVGTEPYPNPFEIETLRNIGTPFILFDYLQFVIFDFSNYLTSTNQANISAISEFETYTPATLESRSFSIRKEK